MNRISVDTLMKIFSIIVFVTIFAMFGAILKENVIHPIGDFLFYVCIFVGSAVGTYMGEQ